METLMKKDLKSFLEGIFEHKYFSPSPDIDAKCREAMTLRLKASRINRFRDMGFAVQENVCCGSGGVGTFRIRGRFLWAQITCGMGQSNYATCVRIGRIVESPHSETGYGIEYEVPKTTI